MTSRPSTPTAQTSRARRKSHRSSGLFRTITQSPQMHYTREVLPLQAPENAGRLEELAQCVSDLQRNVSDLASIHRALSGGFNESFASFLYGLLITMFCNNYPGCPTKDSYESRSQSQTVRARIEMLEEKISAAKSRNSQLHADLEQRKRESRAAQLKNSVYGKRFDAAHARSVTPTRPLRSTSARPHKVAVARDDTSSTVDEPLLETPARVRAAAHKHLATGSSPNLDQPPRYMRGLFEVHGAQNVRRGAASTHPSALKVPASHRVTKRSIPVAARNAFVRTAAPTAASSARTNMSAAQRAQRAQASRLAQRPPFR